MSTWDLSTIYSSHLDFSNDIQQVVKLLKDSSTDLSHKILSLQEGGLLLRELQSYVECLTAQNTADTDAHEKNEVIIRLIASYEKELFFLGHRLAELSTKDFESLLKTHQDVAFYLSELRERACQKASKDKEELINALSVDGYHSFWSLYQSYTGKMRIGKEQQTVGQAYNKLYNANRQTRQAAFREWEAAWKDHSDFIAQILNHLAGFRLKVYSVRGWKNPLQEPLWLNRMQPETLKQMWAAINAAKPSFAKYLAEKAKRLGLEKLSWYDLEAPFEGTKLVSWEKCSDLIIEQFKRFNPVKAQFAKNALDSKWVESEDRTGKAAGGFCVMFPKSNQSRIFMTYKGTLMNVTTLAHELGHAYHNHCVKHLPYFHQQAQMNVAETASTFAEVIVFDQLLALAKTREEKLQLLDDKLQRSIAYLYNIQSRLLFEQAFYSERERGFVSADRLCELMESAQKEAYGDQLAECDPYFWASKLHFYYTHFPFYNFPYTFGYLMSNGLYAYLKKGNDPRSFDRFLEDTAQMNVEELAKKHLDVDLTRPTFWETAVGELTKDIDQYLALCNGEVAT